MAKRKGVPRLMLPAQRYAEQEQAAIERMQVQNGVPVEKRPPAPVIRQSFKPPRRT